MNNFLLHNTRGNKMKTISTSKMRVFTDEEISEVDGIAVVTEREVNEISGGFSLTKDDYFLWLWPMPWMHPIPLVSSLSGTSRYY